MRGMPELDTGGNVTISYSLHRGTRMETIVFLHGLGSSLDNYMDVFNYPELTGYNILLLDHVGHGDSSTPDDFSYSMREMGEHLKHVIDEVAPEGKLSLVLHSMGGAIGILLAEMLGARLQGVVFAEGNIDFDDCFFSNLIITRYTLDEWTESKFDRMLDRFRKDPDSAPYAESFEKAGPLTTYMASVDLVKASRDDALLPKLVGLNVPVLGVFGENNRGKYPSEKRLGEHFPLVFTPDSGHNMMTENPDAFYGAIAEFINSIQ